MKITRAKGRKAIVRVRINVKLCMIGLYQV